MAGAFAEWLPRVIQECKPFYSPDTDKGDVWFSTISDELTVAKIGLVFITPVNKDEPWLNFETGALRTLDTVRVCPIFVGMKAADYNGPAKNFQATNFTDRGDMLRLLRTINSMTDSPLEDAFLVEEFDERWDRLQAAAAEGVKAAEEGFSPQPSPSGPEKRGLEEKVDEVLELLRERRLQEGHFPAVSTPEKYSGAEGSIRVAKDLGDVVMQSAIGLLAYNIEDVPLGRVEQVLYDDKTNSYLIVVQDNGVERRHPLKGLRFEK